MQAQTSATPGEARTPVKPPEVSFLRRRDAAAYLKKRYGHGSVRTLAKLACRGGGPRFRKSGAMVLYDPADLDAWALAKISGLMTSTSDPEGSDAERTS